MTDQTYTIPASCAHTTAQTFRFDDFAFNIQDHPADEPDVVERYRLKDGGTTVRVYERYLTMAEGEREILKYEPRDADIAGHLMDGIPRPWPISHRDAHIMRIAMRSGERRGRSAGYSRAQQEIRKALGID